MRKLSLGFVLLFFFQLGASAPTSSIEPKRSSSASKTQRPISAMVTPQGLGDQIVKFFGRKTGKELVVEKSGNVVGAGAAATQAIDRTELLPGDLVFFNTMRHAFSHVGIYVGNGKFIHAPKPGGEVRVEDMGASYWAKRFDGARRVPADASANVPQQQ